MIGLEKLKEYAKLRSWAENLIMKLKTKIDFDLHRIVDDCHIRSYVPRIDIQFFENGEIGFILTLEIEHAETFEIFQNFIKRLKEYGFIPIRIFRGEIVFMMGGNKLREKIESPLNEENKYV